MEFTITNPLGEEQGTLKEIEYLDIDIGNTNVFNLHIQENEYDPELHTKGCRIYVPGTELGGEIGYRNPITANKQIKIRGYTWYGIIDKEIVEPPAGQDYLYVEGEGNQVLKSLFLDKYGTFVRVSEEDSGINVPRQTVNRYIHMLDACRNIFTSLGARLKLVYEPGVANQTGYLVASIVAITDYSDTQEFSDDGKLNYNIVINEMGVNHLICLGKGELKDRVVVHLYVWPDGTIKRTRYYTGLAERKEIYEYSSIESPNELAKEGTKKLRELMSKTSFKVSVSDEVNLEIGDIVGGRDRITNTLVKAPVISKIYKRQGAEEHITYKLEGEDENNAG